MPGGYGNLFNPPKGPRMYNKFLFAIYTALGVASIQYAPYLTPRQLAGVSVAYAFVGALGVYQTSNTPKPPL